MYFTGALPDMTPRLRTLVTGVAQPMRQPATAAPQVHVSDADHLRAVIARFGSGLTVFGPTALAEEFAGDSSVVVVDIDGDLADMDEIYLCSDHPDGPVSVRIQDYASSPYVSILGSTVVRVTSDDEFEQFLDDADTTCDTGRFAEFLTSPAVALADMTALGYPLDPTSDGPRVRLWVTAEGDVSVSPFGAPVGTIADLSTETLDAAWSQGGASIPLASAVTESLRESGIRERGWVGRYLCAVEAVRSVRSHGHDDVRVSGFGARLDPSTSADADRTRTDLPILAYTSDHAFVWQYGRSLRVSRDAGVLLESLLAQGDPIDPSTDSDDPSARLIGALSSVGIAFPSSATAGA